MTSSTVLVVVVVRRWGLVVVGLVVGLVVDRAVVVADRVAGREVTVGAGTAAATGCGAGAATGCGRVDGPPRTRAAPTSSAAMAADRHARTGSTLWCRERAGPVSHCHTTR